ncbi:uncharacterized protein NPIL_108701 [Nephila pilipes]|uniref:Uncharacterized protein n=1 Tax=Nephila pilipes TaxID=299642 RepID=A0A8X6N5G0_NEPPI|nr:uncharacterized protein NPIL_108701 [Nephila pilipes]
MTFSPLDCNRTYYGLTDLKYPLRLSERRSPTCTLTFIAAGGRYGDRIEITFLSFQIGTFDLDRIRRWKIIPYHVQNKNHYEIHTFKRNNVYGLSKYSNPSKQCYYITLENAMSLKCSWLMLNMSQKTVFKTAEEAIEYLFSEELESEMIVLPPEVDEFTDEEGFDDSETLDPSV